MTLQSLFKRLNSRARFSAARLLRQKTLSISGIWGPVAGFADDEVMLRHYGRCGTWSIAVVEALARAGRESQQTGRPVLFVDVGASIGLVTIGVLRHAPLRALALEPDGGAHALLVANLEAQGLSDRVRVLRVAAGDPKRLGRYAVMQHHPGNGGDIRVRAEILDRTEAPLVDLDSLLVGEESQLLLKIDVQGYEPEVVAGGLQSLGRAKLAAVEFWPYGLRCRGHDPIGFAHLLLAHADLFALIEDEHCCQQPVWIDREEALSRLRQFTNDRPEPEHQLEILMRPTG